MVSFMRHGDGTSSHTQVGVQVPAASAAPSAGAGRPRSRRVTWSQQAEIVLCRIESEWVQGVHNIALGYFTVRVCM